MTSRVAGRIWPVSFNKRFVDHVVSGVKTQTIRAERKDGRVPSTGDVIHCYFGLRTKHTRLLLKAPIIAVHEVVIKVHEQQVWVAGELVGPDDRESLARADGFHTFADMMAWWNGTHPAGRFTGFMLRWSR